MHGRSLVHQPCMPIYISEEFADNIQAHWPAPSWIVTAIFIQQQTQKSGNNRKQYRYQLDKKVQACPAVDIPNKKITHFNILAAQCHSTKKSTNVTRYKIPLGTNAMYTQSMAATCTWPTCNGEHQTTMKPLQMTHLATVLSSNGKQEPNLTGTVPSNDILYLPISPTNPKGAWLPQI